MNNNAQNNNLSNRLLSDYFQLAEASYADLSNARYDKHKKEYNEADVILSIIYNQL